MSPSTPLWTPSPERVAQSQMMAFLERVNRHHDLPTTPPEVAYRALHRWSVDNPTEFWSLLWDFAEVVAEAKGERVLVDGDRMPGARWFPDARLNFAANLLRRRDEAEAVVFWGEDQVKRRLTFRELHDQVAALAAALGDWGVKPGDRVAGYLPNLPETLMAMLATTSLGAVWSSCSPDFGVQGVLDRFGQIEPVVLFAADGYFYGGKTFDSLAKTREIVAQMPSVERVVVVPYTRENPPIDPGAKEITWGEAIAGRAGGDIPFVATAFDHPLYIMYSSGTTGVPKCIVHSVGGTLLQHLKEHMLHTDVRALDRLFYFTTCGWMMWNWQMSALATGATLLLYDGSPFHPDGNILFDYAQREGMTVFGTSAKYLDAVAKGGLCPVDNFDLTKLRAVLSTGSPLAPESFDFVYRCIGTDLQLSSISGGTDIVSCFVLGNPILPVYRGEIQCLGLGLGVEVWNDRGVPVRQEKGELVCTKPLPAMPIYFWNDESGERYHNAYFRRFENVWCHGDYVELTARDGMIIYGRSDTVLNPGGVRIGTAEIYRQVEQLPEVLESLVVGQDWQGDVRVVLFVKLREEVVLDDALTKRIKTQIRNNASPRHVPAKIIPVPDIPRTKSGKIVELAVRQIIHGQEIKNREALANPSALEYYRDLPSLNE
ncbi:MAG: acetoacetate--CoA ligase [Candidatus Competibacterales bacterium]